MNLALMIAGAGAAGGAVYFTVMWFQSRAFHRSMTEIERRNAEIAASQVKEARRTLRQRIEDFVFTAGWKGSLTPLWLANAFLYLVLAVAVRFVTDQTAIVAVLALPLTFAVSYLTITSINSRRRRAFQSQLIQCLELLSAQVKAGSGPARALEEILPSLPDPIRTEMARAVDQARAQRPLVEAIQDIAVEHPSRAMNMFIAALAIDRKQGGKISAALDQAASLLRTNAELVAETKAEIAQQKGQFYLIVGIITGIVLYMLLASGNTPAYVTPMGIVSLLLFTSWALFGVFRLLRTFTKSTENL